MEYVAIIPFDEVEKRLNEVMDSAWTEITDLWLSEMKNWYKVNLYVGWCSEVYSKATARMMIGRLMEEKPKLISELMTQMRKDMKEWGGIPDKVLFDILLNVKAICSDQIRRAYDEVFENFKKHFAS